MNIDERDAELNRLAGEFQADPTQENKAKVLEAWDHLVGLANDSPLTQAEKADVRIALVDLLDQVLDGDTCFNVVLSN